MDVIKEPTIGGPTTTTQELGVVSVFEEHVKENPHEEESFTTREPITEQAIVKVVYPQSLTKDIYE